MLTLSNSQILAAQSQTISKMNEHAFFCQTKNSLHRNSVTYWMSCHTIGHFVFWCHHVTYRMLCHVSGHLVIYCECYGFKRAFFTLRHFLSCTPSWCFHGFPRAGSSTSKLAGLHTIFKTWPGPDYLFKSQQSTKEVYW